ncbi:uncharacterized conserved protein [Moorella thermoacetica Y72]|uniref:Uncharacterized conserved protein n=1 Tax=Moorella thermoacetica Y72 TaxID=1325331 RepID=A0A0S6U6B5_NEOTH|nr:hypothetical protein [Moorella thermoacetica]GAF24679.1 uncharacterized conserved protein [Moorella thermoacetica Y72]
MRIGVDLCNTIANINAMLVMKFTRLSLTRYPDPEIPAGFFSTPEGLELLSKAQPFPYAAVTLRFLASAGHEVIYLTSRPILAVNLTREWLAVNDFPCGALMFLPRGYKALFARYYGIDWFFEDDPQEALSLQGVVCKVFMKTWPYNYGVQGPGIRKFISWREIMPYAAAGKWEKAGAFA